MHANRLHSALKLIEGDFESDEIIPSLANWSNLARYNNRIDEDRLALLSILHKSIIKRRLESARSNSCSPTDHNILKEIGALEHTGKGLWDRLEPHMQSSRRVDDHFTKKIIESVYLFYGQVMAMRASLEFFKIEPTELAREESEIGVLFPKETHPLTIEVVKQELRDLTYVFKSFSEVFDHEYSDTNIRTLSTSDLQLWFECGATVAAGVSLAIERIVALYKSSLEIKKLRADLEKHQIPEEIIESIRGHIDSSIDEKIKELGEEIVEEHYTKDDSGRKKELQTSLSKSLKYIAKKIESGALFEATVGESDESEKATEISNENHSRTVDAAERARLANTAMLEMQSVLKEQRRIQDRNTEGSEQ